jgi:hypothetical protein
MMRELVGGRGSWVGRREDEIEPYPDAEPDTTDAGGFAVFVDPAKTGSLAAGPFIE